jgi:hypothetical protein
MNMKSKLNLNAGPGERLFPIFLGCVLLAVGAMLISADIYTTVVICAAVFIVTAIIGSCLPYFHPEEFGGEGSLKPRARAPRRERSLRVGVKTVEDRTLKPDCSISDDRGNNGLGSESLLDAAVDRIVRSIERDLRIR